MHEERQWVVTGACSHTGSYVRRCTNTRGWSYTCGTRGIGWQRRRRRGRGRGHRHYHWVDRRLGRPRQRIGLYRRRGGMLVEDAAGECAARQSKRDHHVERPLGHLGA